MERDSLTFKTLKNTTYNMIGYVWPMFFSLFITPIIIVRLGVKNYGIYLFVNAIISLFGLLDLGLGTALTKHMSHYYGQKDDKAIATLAHSGNSLFLIIGVIGLLLSAAIAFGGPQLLPEQFASYQAYSSLFIIGGCIFFVATINSTYSASITALQRFDVSNKIGIFSATVSSLGILAVVLANGSLRAILFVQLLISILFAFITNYQARKLLPNATFRFGWDKAEIKHCYTFGIVTFVNNIASTALASLDRLIIPFYVGPSSLTYYSVPGNVSGKIPSLANTLTMSMFPTTSQLDGEKNFTQIEALYVRSFRLITVIAASLTVTCIAFANKTLLFWLNADFASHSSNILIILAVTNFILALFGPLSSFLLGLGKLKFLSTMSVFMGIFNAILLVVLLPRYGITGAAWAYLLSVLPVAFMFYYTETRYLELAFRKKYYIKKISGTALTSVIIFLIDIYLLSPLAVNLASLLAVGGTSVILYIICYRFFGFFEQEDWRDVERFIFEIMKKVPFVRLPER